MGPMTVPHVSRTSLAHGVSVSHSGGLCGRVLRRRPMTGHVHEPAGWTPWNAHGGSAVTCRAWSPDGGRIASCSSNDASLKIWHATLPGVLKASMRSGVSEEGGWLCVAYSPDRKQGNCRE